MAGIKKKVYQYAFDGELIQEWESTISAATSIGLTPESISDCINKQRHIAGGYIWLRTNEPTKAKSISQNKCSIQQPMPNEEWRDIAGYEGMYEVSSHGRVRSLDRFAKSNRNATQFVKGRELTLVTMPNGYKATNLNQNGKGVPKYVHRLVAQAFIPNPSNLPQVNHKDENKSNNCVDNLEWCDNKYNINYGTARERISRSHIALLKGRAVIQLTKDGKMVNTYSNSAIAMRQTGIDASAINKVCLNRPKFKTAGGFIWRYADEHLPPDVHSRAPATATNPKITIRLTYGRKPL